MTFALEINNLTKIYNQGTKKEHKALNNITLNIPKGKFFGLLGPNGAGKSTLINTLATSVVKTSGNIKIMGHDLETDTINAKKSIGIVPQEINFDPFFTPVEALMLQQGLFGITPNRKYCLEILDFMGLSGKESAYMRSLSGGMKRRVLIAKAMVHNPSVIILDEPTAGVDVDLRKRIWDGMIELNKKGTTIILTTHYLEEAETLCEEIAIINKGNLVANDKTVNLLNNLGVKKLILTVNNFANNLPDSLTKFLSQTIDNVLHFTYNKEDESGYIINELSKANITIVNLKAEETNLEEVFIKLTN
ncbi:ABC transporter ATP-binding protein [Rickettsiales bacterium LUAb2]